MSNIQHITAREILNSKGNPTIETTVLLNDGSIGIAACPSGTSTGTHEALELHDHDNTRFQGLGVLKAISNVEHLISPKLVGMDPFDQQAIDAAMIALDGTENKSSLGANAMLSVSMAVAKAAAKSQNKPLYVYISEKYSGEQKIGRMPTPIFNVINGGQHGSGSLDFQEFILVPSSDRAYSETLRLGVTVYQTLKKILKQNKYSILVGDEGGFEPQLTSNYNALDLLIQAIEAAGIRFPEEVTLGLDAAANSFYKDGMYHIKDKPNPLSGDEMIGYYKELAKEFHMAYLEDILIEDSWVDWSTATRTLKDQSMVVGDDLTATNLERLHTAIDKKAITAILIKLNQIGTVSETIDVVQLAKAAGLKVIVSHRSGETNDDFVADFGVAVQADYVKFGAPARGERIAKYNRLLQIEKELQIR